MPHACNTSIYKNGGGSHWKQQCKKKGILVICGHSHQESFEAFLKEPLFDGKTFWEVEKEIEWVD